MWSRWCKQRAPPWTRLTQPKLGLKAVRRSSLNFYDESCEGAGTFISSTSSQALDSLPPAHFAGFPCWPWFSSQMYPGLSRSVWNARRWSIPVTDLLFNQTCSTSGEWYRSFGRPVRAHKFWRTTLPVSKAMIYPSWEILPRDGCAYISSSGDPYCFETLGNDEYETRWYL